MAMNDDQELQLRSGALQNAQSVLQTRGRAEDTLRDQSEWLRITLASIADGVISTDADGRVTFMNETASVLTGWDVSEAVGRPLAEVFHVVDEEISEPIDTPGRPKSQASGKQRMPHNGFLIARSETRRAIEARSSPIRNEHGLILGSVVVFRDVSQRKGAEEAQAFLAAIVASSDDAIVSKTLDGVIRSWNVGAERLFGYTAKEAIGRPITLIIPEELLDQEQEILARIRSGERIDHFETVRVSKQGKRINISLTVSPIRDAGGRIIGASKIARDITDRKRTAEALRESDRRKDEFIALLAHELRNPLAALRNGLHVIRLASHDINCVAKTREMMERQLRHMVRLIDDLLDISRISRSKMELRRTRLLLADVLKSAVEVARPQIEAAGHELSISLPSSPIYLDADLTRLVQVFGNLLGNSAKYSEPKGRIWLTAERSGSEVIISVKDNGIGIPPQQINNIFDMFSQVGRSIERSSGGLGIGLALVKGLVEMHGGSVAAESPGVGKGSAFTVRLPALADRTDPMPLDSTERATDAPVRRILVVDDNRDSATSMAMMLRLMGNEVQTAHDGMEAVEAADQFRPQVILMDVGIPRLTGYEATRRIREQSWGKNMIIIALTGWGQDSDKEKSREAGCNAHLVKPINMSDLLKLLTELAGNGQNGGK
jgi:PAS domain S-box-containing protein